MAVKKIVQYPNKKLREKCLAIEDFESVKSIVQDLKDSLQESKVPGVGLAAPQIGYNKRVFVVRDYFVNDKGEENYNEFVFINPEIIKRSKKKEKSLEGCLSIQDTYGYVQRNKQIKVLYYDQMGKKQVKGVGGFFGFVIQHELDHLNGVLFTDKLVDNKKYTEKEIDKILAKEKN